jgi:hypothetical protein
MYVYIYIKHKRIKDNQEKIRLIKIIRKKSLLQGHIILINNKNSIKNGKNRRRNAACSELSLADLGCISILINLQAIFRADIMNIFLNFHHKQVKVEI